MSFINLAQMLFSWQVKIGIRQYIRYRWGIREQKKKKKNASRSWCGINSHLLSAIFRRSDRYHRILATKDKLPGRAARSLATTQPWYASTCQTRAAVPCQTENSRRTNIATLEIFYIHVIRRTYISRATFRTSYNARAYVRLISAFKNNFANRDSSYVHDIAITRKKAPCDHRCAIMTISKLIWYRPRRYCREFSRFMSMDLQKLSTSSKSKWFAELQNYRELCRLIHIFPFLITSATRF